METLNEDSKMWKQEENLQQCVWYTWWEKDKGG